jgi:hypothetical protein
MNDTSSALHLIAPLGAAVLCWLYLVYAIRRKTKTVPLLDVGLIFTSIVVLYALVPLVGTLVLGDETTLITDNRMLLYRPSSEEIGAFMWRYIAILAGFVITYPKIRKSDLRITFDHEAVHQYWGGVFAIVAVLTIYFFVLTLTTGVLSARSYNEAFSGDYAEYTSLPLFVQQITGRLAGILFAAKLALVMIVVGQFRTPAWRYGGFVWLLYEFLSPFVELGSRSNSLFVIFAFIVCFHTMVRPVSFGIVALAATTLLGGFFIQGVLRSGSYVGEFGILEATLSMNEFQSLFGTAYDIYMRLEAGDLQIPWQVYLGDYLRPIPQQLLPFEKVDQSEWYLELIGYKGEGVGFMFGIISEGLIGFGIWELAFRGVVLGLALALIHNMVCRRGDSFMWVCFYLWLCTRIYLSFRGSTFFWLSSFVLEFLPFALAVRVLRNRPRYNSLVARTS